MKLTALTFFAVLLLRTLDYSVLEDNTKDQPQPCNSQEARQFDFWLGEWDLSWTDKDGSTKSGTNRISKLFGNCNIKEEFSDAHGVFKGMSVSTFDPSSKKWKQTWVDNTGSYLDFAGEFNSGRMVLSRRMQKDGKELVQRMQWYNITPNSLTWTWERSDDNGKTWTVLWNIRYNRRKGETQG